MLHDTYLVDKKDKCLIVWLSMEGLWGTQTRCDEVGWRSQGGLQ